MTLIFKGKRKQYVCGKCDSDPLKSPKANTLIASVKPSEEG